MNVSRELELISAYVQVSMKYRGFKQVFKGLRTIQFDDGDIVEFLEGPTFLVKSAHRHTVYLGRYPGSPR